MNDWQTLLKLCDDYRIDPARIVNPKKHNDNVSASDRRVIIRELRKLDFSTKRISLLVPLTTRAIREAISFKRQQSSSASSSVSAPA